MAIEILGGTADVTADVEYTLATISDDGSYVLNLGLSEMVNGATPDRTVVRVYTEAGSGDGLAKQYEKHFEGAQTLINWMSPEYANFNRIRFTIEQYDGTARDYRWSVGKVNR
jgi:hypothetical protein